MIINEKDLINTDFKIIKTFDKEHFSFSQVLDDMTNNVYSRLENYYKDKFYFIKFKDEEVIIENSNQEQFIVFGKYRNDFFVINQDSEVYLLEFLENNSYKLMFINSSLLQFMKCYCLLLSIFFYVNGKHLGEQKAKRLARKLKKDIKKIDERTLNSLFYQNYLFDIENLELPVHFTPIDYVYNDRHTIPNEL